ncbi:hypothetical protein [Streptomyces sp. CO7]
MTQAAPHRSRPRRLLTLLVTTALLLPVSVTVTLTAAGPASASCAASPFAGRWRSPDPRLSRIDIWHGEDCQLYAKAWSRCEHDASRNCSWGSRGKALQGGGGPSFRFFYYNWSDADEVLQLRLRDGSHISVWDHVDYHSGADDSYTVPMTKSAT